MARSSVEVSSVAALFDRRSAPIEALARDATAVAMACHAMAIRFHQGGKLVVFGNGGPSTDAQHVAVEFVHPVIVGKRALPAISLTADIATITGIANRDGLAEIFAHQIRFLAERTDIALGISTDGDCENVLRGLRAAHDLGMLTIALVGGKISADQHFDHVLIADSNDPRVIKEVHVTTYHILWELVHVFFEQPGILAPGVLA